MGCAQAVWSCRSISGRCRCLSRLARIRLSLPHSGLLRMAQVGFSLGGLPLRLWVYPLPTLLRRLTSARRTRPRSVAVDDAVRTVVRVCQARLFCLPIFPGACL